MKLTITQSHNTHESFSLIFLAPSLIVLYITSIENYVRVDYFELAIFPSPCLLRKRVTSEQWLIRDLGAYLPGVCEEVCNQSSIVF